MNPSTYRPELPDLPRRMRSLPVLRAYPVPWFVAKNPDTGEYDFRVMDARKWVRAVTEKRCWVCGEPLGRNFAFTIGPMCAVNRVSSEPPGHIDCADFSARACPFLTRPHEKRRGDVLEEYEHHGVRPAPGAHLERNPGAALVWITDSYRIIPAGVESDPKIPGATYNPRGYLIKVGVPVEVRWYCEGRRATRAEIEASIDSGFPSLMEAAKLDGADAIRMLEAQKAEAMRLLPAA